jgi:hypothetical protein
MLRKYIVSAYSIVGTILLLSVLTGVLTYAFTMGFYAINAHWVVPFIVSPTNEKILSLTSQLISTQQSLNVLTVDRDRLEASLGDMRKARVELGALDRQFRTAIAIQTNGNAADAPDLSALNMRKSLDNAKTAEVLRQVSEVDNKIDAELKAGLITKSDAAMAKTTMRQSMNVATDGLISEVLLRESVRSKSPTYITSVDALSREAELKSNLAQLTIAITSGEEQHAADVKQITTLQAAIETEQGSPYFLATKGNVHFAFVGYSAATYAGVKKPVYSCLLGVMLCHRVGTVTAIFTDEERAVHPIFKTDMRGFLIQLDLTEPEAAKEKVLFLGHRPLGI